MILKKVILDNIRSYEHEEVEFKEGSTLLAGDIGSGKTSILLAIEFGLFGLQPGQRGASLLRNGKEEGGVILEFKIDEKTILVERTLKKGKTISQDYAAITIDGEKQELSVTELKQRVLNLLNYPLEFSKKQNILYKFTVYTPQEEMKQIILEDPETRVNTLRHVFGIDKYKTILENVAVLRLKLREEKKLMEGITSNLDEDKGLREKKKKELALMDEKIIPFSGEVLIRIENRKKKEKEKQEIVDKIQEKAKLKEEIGKSKILLISKQETLANNEVSILELNNEILAFQNLNFEESKMQELEEIILKNKKQKDVLSEMNLNISSEIMNLRIKEEENKKIQDKMSNLEVCPTCLQDVDSVYRANILNKAHNEMSQGKSRIEELELEKKNLSENLKKIILDLEFNEKELMNLKILRMKLEGIKEKQTKLDALRLKNESLGKDLNILNKHLSSLNDSVLKFSKYDLIFEEKEKELKEAFRQEKMSEIKLAELKREMEVYSDSIKEFEERIRKIEEIKIKLIYVTELEMWLTKKFVPVIAFIEKNVMISLKQEFSKLFSEWFDMLVPENFNVRLGDDFTPIIEQQDYEIDYAYLSGGERTAIALAYRLSLNQVINSLMSKIKTRDLVILDEPTDGFSDQQLDKMREVLDQLNIKQLIIVSHEQKIEGFVENVIKFKKDYGVSWKE